MAADSAFKALSDPTRREVLRLLRRHGEMTAGELSAHFEDRLTKPSMSHHFAVLRAADLVRTRRAGQQIVYSLNTTAVQDLLAMIWDLFPAQAADGREGEP